MPKKVFISYRRVDSSWAASAIHDALETEIGSEHVFMDLKIPLGIDFTKYLDEQVRQCDVLLAIMGHQWLNEIEKRWSETNDYVRIEIRQALLRDIPVVPVLLDGTQMPSEAGLPEDIRELRKRNAAFLSMRTKAADLVQLVDGLHLHEPPSPRADHNVARPPGNYLPSRDTKRSTADPRRPPLPQAASPQSAPPTQRTPPTQHPPGQTRAPNRASSDHPLPVALRRVTPEPVEAITSQVRPAPEPAYVRQSISERRRSLSEIRRQKGTTASVKLPRKNPTTLLGGPRHIVQSGNHSSARHRFGRRVGGGPVVGHQPVALFQQGR